MRRPCEACGAILYVNPARAARGSGRFCSRACARQHHREIKTKAPIRTLAHNIQIVSEYGSGLYVICRVRPHPFFAGTVTRGAVTVRRCRVIMSAHLGRALQRAEHVHHINGDKHADEIENLELLSPLEHNREHKLGSRHTAVAKATISKGLRRAYQEGRRALPTITERDIDGRILDSDVIDKLTAFERFSDG